MSKAEERALEVYPIESHEMYDDLYRQRNAYVKGYHQAEKDLELTWKDMRELYVIFAEVDAEIELCKADNIKSETIGYYQEVLKRFKNFKEREEK